MKRIIAIPPPLLLIPVLSLASNGFFLNAGMGFFNSHIGRKNTYLLGASKLPFSYFNTEEDSSVNIYNFAIGYQKALTDNLDWKLSFNYLQSQSRTLKGYFAEDQGDTQFFDYQFKVASHAFLWRNDLLFHSSNNDSLWYRLKPYIGFSIGGSVEKGYGYTQDSTENGYTPHANQSNFNLAYGLDAGLQYQFNINNAIQAEMEYLSLGRATLGPFQNNGLYTKNLRGFAANLSYSYYF